MFVLIVRSLLGLLLIVFGMNTFLEFMEPAAPSSAGKSLMHAIHGSGYMWQVIGGVKILTGCLLLFKRSVPFALILLAPISVNIVLYHVFLDPPFTHAAMAYAVAAANIGLAVKHWDSYRGLFR